MKAELEKSETTAKGLKADLEKANNTVRTRDQVEGNCKIKKAFTSSKKLILK